jgi:hypothetical protein
VRAAGRLVKSLGIAPECWWDDQAWNAPSSLGERQQLPVGCVVRYSSSCPLTSVVELSCPFFCRRAPLQLYARHHVFSCPVTSCAAFLPFLAFLDAHPFSYMLGIMCHHVLRHLSPNRPALSSAVAHPLATCPTSRL